MPLLIDEPTQHHGRVDDHHYPVRSPASAASAPEPQASVALSDDELEAITGGAGNTVAMQSLTLANEGISTARSGGDADSFDCSELVQWASHRS